MLNEYDIWQNAPPYIFLTKPSAVLKVKIAYNMRNKGNYVDFAFCAVLWVLYKFRVQNVRQNPLRGFCLTRRGLTRASLGGSWVKTGIIIKEMLTKILGNDIL